MARRCLIWKEQVLAKSFGADKSACRWPVHHVVLQHDRMNSLQHPSSSARTTTTMSGKRSKIQFIHSPYSKLTRGALVETQRRVHSHAAWAAHAKARQLRVMKFGNVEDGRQPFSNASFNVDTAVMPSPVGLLGSNRRDPFASVARHLNPIEEFCLDYCK